MSISKLKMETLHQRVQQTFQTCLHKIKDHTVLENAIDIYNSYVLLLKEKERLKAEEKHLQQIFKIKVSQLYNYFQFHQMNNKEGEIILLPSNFSMEKKKKMVQEIAMVYQDVIKDNDGFYISSDELQKIQLLIKEIKNLEKQYINLSFNIKTVNNEINKKMLLLEEEIDKLI